MNLAALTIREKHPITTPPHQAQTVFMFLTDAELTDLTGAKRRDGRVRALRAMGVEYRIRPDGHVIVLRSHVETLLGGALPAIVSASVSAPDWSALAASKKA